jgi:outer membrane receptor for ferrienterochelin and colicins
VITRKEIFQRGYADLVELLKDVPGFDITLFYGSEYANIYQRGFRQNNTEKTLLLIDGVEENDLWTNWAYIDRQYPLSNIERVEIIYGPASTMYGPNAFAGVINVITRSAMASIPQGQKIGISANILTGNYATRAVDITLAGTTKNISFSLTGRLFDTEEHDLSVQSYFDYDPAYYDGIDYGTIMGINNNAAQYITNNGLPFEHPYYSLSTDSNQLTLTQAGIEAARNLDKSAYEQVVNGSKIGYSNQSKNGLLNGKVQVGNFVFGFQTWRYSRGSLTQYTDNYVPGSDNGFIWVPQQTYLYTRYENQINDKFFFSNLTTYRIHTLTQDSKFVSVANYARGNRKIADLVNGIAPSWTTQYAFSNSSQLRTEFKTIYTPGTRFSLVSGVELRNGTLQGAYLFSLTSSPQDSAIQNPSPLGGNSYISWDMGIYSQGSYRLADQLHLTLGLRYDYNRVRSRDGFGSVISPRVAAVYTPGDYTFKAVYSRGIMNVSNWTKYSSAGNRIPNPTLKTENIQNFEFSALHTWNRSLTSEINIYHARIDDVVGTVPVEEGSALTHNDNIGKFIINGAQMNARYQLKLMTAWFNYTWCDPRQTYSETGEVDNRVGDIATHQFNFGVNQELFQQINVNLRMNYSGKREVGSGTTVPLNNADFPGIAVFSGAVTYSNPKIIKGLELQLVCNNLTDKEYYHPGTKVADGISSPTGILQRGRHFVIQLRYEY